MSTILRDLDLTNSELSFLLTDDESIQSINREYREKDKVTDVISFPLEGNYPPGFQGPRILGDIIISLPQAKRQAVSGYYLEVLILAIHGLCHVLGHDHQDEEDTSAMKAEEARMLKRVLGRVGESYLERQLSGRDHLNEKSGRNEGKTIMGKAKGS